jgi:fermentation-respiration switch protein FrsA (DUF1100 family)
VKFTDHIALRAGRDVAGGRRLDVELETEPERVPAILLVPRASGTAPGALLLHGAGSSKERMADSVGRALLRRGVASLAVDLPLHGARAGAGTGYSMRNPLQLAQTWRMALAEGRQALRYLAEHAVVDPRRLAVVGYSLGAYLGVVLAASEPLCRAVVLAAGGDLPEQIPFGRLVRTVADPLRAARKLDGRPLLMVHGRGDRTITPAQAERLFEAAREPKELRWYQGGHWPPQSAIDDAAAWLAKTLGEQRGRKAVSR